VIEFASHHTIAVIAILVAVAVALRVFVHKKRPQHIPRAVEHLDSAIRFTESQSKTDPLTFWREEIRSIAGKYGSPVKAAIQLERSINALDLKALSDGELESLQTYWREISNWCGKLRMEPHRLDPQQEWSPSAWTRLFNVFGKINLLVKIVWDERSRRATRKPNEV
jgi:hypothetical protein